jgi:hypothetical protein
MFNLSEIRFLPSLFFSDTSNAGTDRHIRANAFKISRVKHMRSCFSKILENVFTLFSLMVYQQMEYQNIYENHLKT